MPSLPFGTWGVELSWCRSVSISRSVSIRKWFFRPFEHIFWFKILIFGRSLPTPNFTGFRLKSTPVAQCLRAMPKHSSRNDLCLLCSFSKREKLHRQFLDGQTDQKLQSLFWAYFWTEFRYTQIIRGRIDGSQGVVFWTPSKYLCTEILYCALIDTDREIDTDRHRERSCGHV